MLPRLDSMEHLRGESKLDNGINPFNNYWKDIVDHGISGVIFDKDDYGNMIIEVDVPGFNKDNLEVNHTNGKLYIQGQSDNRNIEKAIALASNRQIEKATVNDGILTVKVSKKENDNTKISLEE